MSTQTPTIGNLTAEEVYTSVVKGGLTPSQANAFVGEWLVVNAGKAKRIFNYSQAFNNIENACTPNFARSFAHQDWIDGESVVQASQTPDELGFNERFHRIEGDLDSLGANVALAFTCMANMRKQLRSLLDEIRVEINRINADVDACCNSGSGPVTFTPPGYVAAGAFLGKFKINEKYMQLWQTPGGMVMLPDLETTEGPIWNDPRTQRTGKYARYVEENPEVRKTFPGAVTKSDFVKKFGNDRLPDGTFVRDLMDMLPDTGEFVSLDVMGVDLTNREAAALRTTPGAREAAALSLGVAGQGGNLDSAKIEQFGALPVSARTALARNGVNTLGQFAALAPDKLNSMLKKENVNMSAGDVAESQALGRSIVQL